MFSDLRSIDLYEDAIMDHRLPEAVPPDERKGNWVQEFQSDHVEAVFVNAQFFRYQEVEEFIKENFSDRERFYPCGGTS